MSGNAAAQQHFTDVRPTTAVGASEQQARRREPRGWVRFGAPFRAKKIKAQTEAFCRNAERFRTLLQHSSDAVVVVGRDLRILYATGPVERMLGRCPGDLRGTTFADLVYPQEWSRVEALLTKTVEGPGATSTQNIRLRRGDRGWLRSQTVVANLLADPNVQGLVLTIRDVSQRRALEDQLRQIAFHDPLTGLPNRAGFLDGVAQALALDQGSDELCAVLVIEIDDLKRVNSLGHSAGDQLLQAIAERIQQILGSNESLMLARLREDEFAILAENLTDPEDAVALADRLLVAFHTSVEIEGRSILPRANIGIATTVAGVETSDELLRNADVAMYQARHRGRGCYELFNPAMHAAAIQRLELEQELRWAVERQEFVVHYQLVVRLGDFSISGVEALLRWQHPERGLILPDDFIPLAEETGLIIPIGDWMLREACRHGANLQRQGDDRLRVAVNVSPRQFTDPSFEEQIALALDDSGIDPTTLVLEITETGLMADTEDMVGRMVRLRQLGLSFAMDDFGRGYSSFSYLRQYPIQMLKIDRSFIDALGEGEENTALVLAILSLASTLGMQVVAEGVEEAWQAELLQRLGCTLAQGFYFARPMDRQDLALILGGSVEDRTLPIAGTSAVVCPCNASDKVMLLSPLGLPVAGCLPH
jgi:diguanylate cyclase (GGDEF)-like protein/PAS domain S-box-containing protein